MSDKAVPTQDRRCTCHLIGGFANRAYRCRLDQWQDRLWRPGKMNLELIDRNVEALKPICRKRRGE